MRIEFREEFDLPVQQIFEYFKTPANWSYLYGLHGSVADLGDGWFAVPLQRFPFPLIAKVTDLRLNEYAHWEFRGFWRGEGEIRFRQTSGKVVVSGYETISIRWLYILSPLVEKIFIEKQFRGVWRYGWRKLRDLEKDSGRG